MKPILALVLAALLALAGCAGQFEATSPSTIPFQQEGLGSGGDSGE